jgi:hypothetical protein
VIPQDEAAAAQPEHPAEGIGEAVDGEAIGEQVGAAEPRAFTADETEPRA